MNKGYLLNSSLVEGFAFLLLISFSTGSFALSGPTNNNTGNFSLTYDGVLPFGNMAIYLKEFKNGQFTRYIGVTAGGGTESISVSSTGQYKYEHWREWCSTSEFPPPPTVPQCPAAKFNKTKIAEHAVNVAIKPGVPGAYIGFPTQDGDGVFDVKWGVSTGTVSRYELNQKLVGGSYGGDIHGTTATTHGISVGNGRYQYQVRACGQAGSYSQCSNWRESPIVEVAKKPGVPGLFENFPTQDGDGVYTVKWGASTGSLTRYELNEKVGTGGWSGDIHNSTATSKGRDVDNGSYTYQVRACMQTGSYSNCSNWRESPTVDVAHEPPPTAALSLSNNTAATYDKEGIFKVKWGAASGNPFTGYQVYQKKNTGGYTKIYDSTNKSVREVERPDGCSNFPTNCPPGLTDGDYQFYARTWVTVGNYTRYSDNTYSGTIEVLQEPNGPNQINQPSSTVTSTPFTVSWDSVPGEVTYTLEYSTDNINFSQYSSGHTSPSNPNVNLENDTYYFRVRACNSYGDCGNASPSKQVSVNVAPPIPEDPTFTSVPATSDYGDFEITWQSNAGNVTHYRLQQKVNSQPWPTDSPANDTDLGQGNETTYEADGETEGAYQFRLKACNTEVSCTENWVYSGPIDVHNLQGIAPVVSTEQQPQYMTAGAMNYSTDVNFRGDATISVPIQGAPGVNGQAPNLSLSYSSGQHRRHKVNDLPEDVLGYGWYLDGIPEIRRCVTNRPTEDKIQLDDSDSICLSGNPLVLMDGNHWQTGAVYRTLRDRFVLVEIKGTSDESWFEVKQPDGSVQQYGATTDSRILIDNNEGKTPYYAWTLNKVTDSFGNTITYNYHRDSVNGINYPLSILYGNNNDAKIEFEYATRDDAVPMPIGDTEFEQGQLVLLHHINILLDGNILREYRLIPETAPEGWKRLDKIQHCAYEKDSQPQDLIYKCLAPLSFSWMTSASANQDEFLTAVQTVDDGTKSTVFTHALMSEGGFEGDMPEEPFGVGILPNSAEAEPLQAVNGEYRYIVTSVSRSNGIGGNHDTNYRYQGTGFQSKKHWGFLGYYAQGVQDGATGITTYRQFRLDFPHFGQVARLYQYDHIFGSHSEMLSKQRYRYDNLVLNSNGNDTHFPFLRASLDSILEGGQELGFNYNWNDYGKAGYGNNGELLNSATHVQRVVTDASTPGTETFWGEMPTISVDGTVERSRRVVTSYHNRTSPWLVGFVDGESEEHFDGDTGGTAERTITAMATPFGNTNRIHTLTRFPGDTRYELNVQYGYNGNGNLNSETISGHTSAVPGAEIEQRSSSASNFLDKRYPQTLTNALSQSMSVAYDQRFGLPESVSDANSRTTLIEYDHFGRELERTNPDNVAITTVYEDCNNVFDSYPCPMRGNQLVSYRVTTSSAITPTSYRYYDALNRLVQMRYEAFEPGATVVQDRFFDNKGLLVEESVPHFGSESVFASVSYEYDLRNRLETTYMPGGGTVRVDYLPQLAQHQVLVQVEEDILDSLGSLAETQVKENYYSLTGDLVKTTDDQTGEYVTTHYDYDGSGLPESIHVEDLTTESEFIYDHAGYRTTLIGPNIGNVTTEYNALGQLVKQTDNKNQSIGYQYDLLGRLKVQTDAEGVGNWFYDPANGIGGLDKRTYTTGGISVFEETHSYNGESKLDRIDTELTAGGETRSFTHSYAYNGSGDGRLDSITYPSGIAVKYQYTGGYLSAITDGSGYALKTFNSINAFGQVVSEEYGNNVITTRTYNPDTGQLESLSTTGSSQFQNSEYHWRSNDTLESRLADIGTASQKEERFSYDGLSRLTSAETLLNGSSQRTLTTLYNKLGNIQSKTSSHGADTNVTGYQYGEFGNAGPNAVSNINIAGESYSLQYDTNGAITHYDAALSQDKWVSWNARQLPTEITLGDSQFTATPTARDKFQYGPNGQRFYRESSWMENGELQTEKSFYVGSFEEQLPADTAIEKVEKTTIDSNIAHVAITDSLGTTGEFQYLHRDHLGSIEKITDQNGDILLKTAFDPSGKRRKADWSQEIDQQELDALLLSQGFTTKRGFTGHEHLDRTGLIHMNGRIYDPTLGRFLSPDPIVQAPGFSQSWNRYSYVYNSPVNVTDPSGLETEDTPRPVPNKYCPTGSHICHDNKGGSYYSGGPIPGVHSGSGWLSLISHGSNSQVVNGFISDSTTDPNREIPEASNDAGDTLPPIVEPPPTVTPEPYMPDRIPGSVMAAGQTAGNNEGFFRRLRFYGGISVRSAITFKWEDEYIPWMADFTAGLTVNPGMRRADNGLVEGLAMQIEALATANYNGDGYGFNLLGRGLEGGLLWEDAKTIAQAQTFYIDTILGGGTIYLHPTQNYPVGILVGGPSFGFSFSRPSEDGFSGGWELLNTGTQR